MYFVYSVYSYVYIYLCYFWLIYIICIFRSLLHLRLLSMPDPFHLHLLYLSCLFCLYLHLYLLCLVCLFYLHPPWLAPSISIIYTLSALFVSIMPRSLILLASVVYTSFTLFPSAVPKLSTLSTFFIAYSVYVLFLCLIRF